MKNRFLSTVSSNFLSIVTFLATLCTLVMFSFEYAGAPDFKWVGIAAIAIFALGFGTFSTLKSSTLSIDRIDLWLAGFFSYAAVSLLWSPDPRAGAMFLAFFGALWAIFTFFKNAPSERIRISAGWAIAIAGAAIVLMHKFEAPILGMIRPAAGQYLASNPGETLWSGFINRQFITEFLLLTLPFMAWVAFISRRNPLMLTIASGVLLWTLYFLIWVNPSKIEFFVLPPAMLLFLAYLGWRKYPKITIIGSVIAVTLLGFALTSIWDQHFILASNSIKDSVLPRAMLYWNTLFMWLDKPLLGQGLGGFEANYPLYHELFIHRWPEAGLAALASKFKVAGAAHNDYLQFLAEFGLVGLALVFMAATTAIKALRGSPKLDPLVKAGLAVVGFAALNELIEFPLQVPATALIIVISLGMILNSAKKNIPAVQFSISRPTKIVAAVCSAALVIVAVAGTYRFDAAQKEFSIVINLHDSDPETAFTHHLKAYQYNPLDPQLRTLLYQSLHTWNLAKGTPPLPPARNDEIFKISLSAGPQELTVVRRVQYLLDTGRVKTDKVEIERWLDQLRKHSFFRADTWIANTYYLHLTGHSKDESLTSLGRANKVPHDIAQDQQMFALYQLINGSGHDQAFPIE